MNASENITHRDIAELVGVSTYVVSKALAGKAGVAPATREKVRAAAKKLGYQRNTVASLLATQRHSSRLGGLRPVIAMLHSNEHSNWAKYQADLFMEVCEASGLDGRVVATSETLSARMLHARGVDGILLDAHGQSFPPEVFNSFGWDLLPVVKLGRGYAGLHCHLVRLSAFDYMWNTLRETHSRGYRHLAVLLHESASPQDDSARLGAVLAFAEQFRGAGVTLSWRRTDLAISDDMSSHVQWLRAAKPDACICDHWGFAARLHDAGIAFPAEMACAAAIIPENLQALWPGSTFALAGCLGQARETYQRGLRILSEQIARNERGILEEPMESVIEPCWRDGASLPGRD